MSIFFSLLNRSDVPARGSSQFDNCTMRCVMLWLMISKWVCIVLAVPNDPSMQLGRNWFVISVPCFARHVQVHRAMCAAYPTANYITSIYIYMDVEGNDRILWWCWWCRYSQISTWFHKIWLAVVAHIASIDLNQPEYMCEWVHRSPMPHTAPAIDDCAGTHLSPHTVHSQWLHVIQWSRCSAAAAAAAIVMPSSHRKCQQNDSRPHE